jgi:hypothetical protein
MIRARHSKALVTVYRHDLLDLLSYALEGQRPPADLHVRMRDAAVASLDAEGPRHPLLQALTGDEQEDCAACGNPIGSEPFGIEMPSARVTHDRCYTK